MTSIAASKGAVALIAHASAAIQESRRSRTTSCAKRRRYACLFRVRTGLPTLRYGVFSQSSILFKIVSGLYQIVWCPQIAPIVLIGSKAQDLFIVRSQT